MLRSTTRVFRVAHSVPRFGSVFSCGAKSSSVLKDTPEIYYNWIASTWSLKGVAESITHPNNLDVAGPGHFELALYRMQRAGQWERMEPVVKFMEKETSFQPTEKMYGFLLMGYSKGGQHQRIIDRFQELKEKEGMLSQQNWNIYLLALARNNDCSKMLEEFEVYKQAGYDVTEYSYHAIIEGLMVGKRYSEAYDMIKTMKKNGLTPTTKTFTILVNYYARHEQYKRAIDTIATMKKHEPTQPNIVTYTSLIHGMSINGKQLEGFEWLKKLYKEEIQPNLYTYTTLIKSFDATRQYGYVIRLWKMLKKDSNIEIPLATKNYVVKIIKKAGTSLSDTGEEPVKI